MREWRRGSTPLQGGLPCQLARSAAGRSALSACLPACLRLRVCARCSCVVVRCCCVVVQCEVLQGKLEKAWQGAMTSQDDSVDCPLGIAPTQRSERCAVPITHRRRRWRVCGGAASGRTLSLVRVHAPVSPAVPAPVWTGACARARFALGHKMLAAFGPWTNESTASRKSLGDQLMGLDHT